MTAPLDPLRRRRPIALHFERGTPVDRHYIAAFLDANARDVHGRVLEVGDAAATRRYGGGRVTQSHVLHAAAGNPEATFVGDLATGTGVPRGAYDCVIAVNVYTYIFDLGAAIANTCAALAPGGVLLAALPCISMISRRDMDAYGDFWRFTDASARRLFAAAFGASNVAVTTYGNLFSAAAFLACVAAEELAPDELDDADPDYVVTVGVRAVRT